MENNQLILYETIVKYDKPKFDTKLIVTKKKINLEKKKGIFKKEYKIIESINIDDIKIYNDKVKVINNNAEVEIDTISKIYKVTCNNIIEAKKLVEEIIKIKTGANLIERTSNKVVKIGKNVANTATAIGGAVTSIGLVAKTINQNKKEILKAIETVKDVIKR